ncbi:hypothetical protein, partial [Planktothrix agardhii]|uniref:hypothetical protein n=1 Tax=Planktothrix agardhii TaxID=1160 RepID=UPI002B1F973A
SSAFTNLSNLLWFVKLFFEVFLFFFEILVPSDFQTIASFNIYMERMEIFLRLVLAVDFYKKW